MPDSDPILTKADELVREVRQLLHSPADRAALRHSLGRPPEDATLAVAALEQRLQDQRHVDQQYQGDGRGAQCRQTDRGTEPDTSEPAAATDS